MNETQKKVAPWKCYKGHILYEGDFIAHPANGDTAKVVYLPDEPEYKWRAKYDNGELLFLQLQVGDKGQAEKVKAHRDAAFPDGVWDE